MSKAFTVDAVFRGVDKFSGPLARMSDRAERFQKRMERGVQSLNNVSGGIISGLKTAATFAAGAGAILGTAVAKVVEAGSSFEATMSGVAAVSNATDTEMAALKARALELGKTTKFSATEVAGGMEIMSKAGLKVNEVLTGLPGLLSAAAADGAGIEDTANSLMSSMKAMGLGPTKMQLFADEMAKAGDATKASIGSISESLAIVGPVFKQLNVPMESAIAQIALLQDAGIDASSAGTTLGAAYSKLAAPMGRTKDALKTLGLSVKDSMGNMKPPEQLLGEILGATSKIKGNVGQMAAFTELVGLESQKALLNVASAAKDGRLNSLVSDLKDAGGYADTIAKKRLNNFTGDVTMLRSAVEGVSIKLFDMEKGPLRGVVQGMTDWIRMNDDLIVSGISEFIQNAIPLVQNFAEGMKDAFADSVVIGAIQKTAEAVGGIFGMFNQAEGPRMQAYLWGKDIADLGFALIGFIGFVKLAEGAVWGYGAAIKVVKAAEWMWDLGKATKDAIQAIRVAKEVGPAGIVALGQAMRGASGDAVTLAQNTQGLAGWFDTAAKKAGLAAVAIGAVYAAYDQATSFLAENGGMEGLNAFLGIGTEDGDYGFTAVDAMMNKKAKAQAQWDAPSVTPASLRDPTKSAAVDRLFGVPGPGFDGYGAAPQNHDQGATPTAQPQVASPWSGMNPDELKGLFKSTIDVNIKDPGKIVDGVEVKSPGKTLAPVNPRSGTK